MIDIWERKWTGDSSFPIGKAYSKEQAVFQASGFGKELLISISKVKRFELLIAVNYLFIPFIGLFFLLHLFIFLERIST